MVSESELDKYRQDGTKIRVVRDGLERNDVIGIVVAWDADTVLIRRHNRRVVKLSRAYVYEPFESPRTDLTQATE
ncbi:hypothetical protein [Paenibacillus methanolicus]|uniref:Uncharacterized protein n=1 Tax=Paenibacillus methanolicus TaxID=582686 RepID=A0A5S5C5R5_9BACL|nr:hypothetical protein [Paenibacillus methanolicus]TYP73736.1 hypothetical protein BCM02_10612 [Paenibacillus methanolicus]